MFTVVLILFLMAIAFIVAGFILSWQQQPVHKYYQKKYHRELRFWSSHFLILFCVFIFTIIFLRSIWLSPSLITVANTIKTTVQTQVAKLQPAQQQTQPKAQSVLSARTVPHISQVDPIQFSSTINPALTESYDVWWPSACSAAATTAVLDSYGHNYRLADILAVESRIGEITPQLGLVEPMGIENTVSHFQFKDTVTRIPVDTYASIDKLAALANHGTPVIVNFPPDRWDGGHFLVVSAVDNTYVHLVDSSRLNMHLMYKQTFLKYFGGLINIVTPA